MPKIIPQKNNLRIKSQDDNFIVFNLETSGFHLLTKDCIDILEAIDGKKSIEDLAHYFASERNLEFDNLYKDFQKFFDELETRKLVTLKQED